MQLSIIVTIVVFYLHVKKLKNTRAFALTRQVWTEGMTRKGYNGGYL